MSIAAGTPLPGAAPFADRAVSRRRVFGWMMFDWASQPFYTLVLTFVFGPFFAVAAANWFASQGAGAEEAKAAAQTVWSRGQSLTGLAIALSAPLLGALADTSGRRMPWIAAFSALYVLGVAGLWVMVPDGSALWLALGFFGLAMIGAEFATIFTNALLPGLGPPHRIGRISGAGFALGYVGGVVSLVVMLLLFAENEAGVTLLGSPPPFGLDATEREGTRLVGPFAAAWYAVFMVPFFLWVREAPAPGAGASLGAAWSDLKASLAGAARRPSLAAWLAGSMLYRDALVALYAFAGVYAALVLDWSTVQIGVFGILGAVTAAVATWAGGLLDERLGPKPVIVGSILTLMAACAVIVGMSREALFGVPLPGGSPLPDRIMYALGAVVGGAGGVLQAASRTMMVRHADPARPTEAFALYALSGKATAFLAPTAIGLATAVSQSPRLGLSPIILLFAAGLALMVPVRAEGDADLPPTPIRRAAALGIPVAVAAAIALLLALLKGATA